MLDGRERERQTDGEAGDGQLKDNSQEQRSLRVRKKIKIYRSEPRTMSTGNWKY